MSSNQPKFRSPGYTHGTAPSGMAPHLVVKLKKDWRYVESTRQFVSTAGLELALTQQLPPGSRIVHTAPGLAQADSASLSPAERNLVRYLQIILPVKSDAKRLLPRVLGWACVEEARLGAEVSLPK